MKVLIVGCGNMGRSHAQAYHRIEGCTLVGLVNRHPEPRLELSKALGGVPHYSEYKEALRKTKPDIVVICTHVAFHAPYAKLALEKNAHVFVEKPIAESVEEGKEVIELAEKKNKKLLVGFILRHHSSWKTFIKQAQSLGSPLVMRLNLNQQSSGKEWNTHKSILESQSPIVDCGVHYVDVMCQMTRSNPIRVSAIGARLSNEISEDQYNYGQLQVTFEDGSIGWYESGWGPMMSENAYFIKDVIGPKGSVSMVPCFEKGSSSDLNQHTKGEQLLFHSVEMKDQVLSLEDEPDHLELCRLEQLYLLSAIEKNLDLTEHYRATLSSLRIVLAADQSIKEQRAVSLV